MSLEQGEAQQRTCKKLADQVARMEAAAIVQLQAGDTEAAKQTLKVETRPPPLTEPASAAGQRATVRRGEPASC